MSYFLVDERGTAHDLATNAGLDELYAQAEAAGAAALLAMLDGGEATAAERVAILAELEGRDGFEGVAAALRGLTGRVAVSNGVVEQEEDMDEVALNKLLDDVGAMGVQVSQFKDRLLTLKLDSQSQLIERLVLLQQEAGKERRVELEIEKLPDGKFRAVRIERAAGD